ncbi:sulfatase [Labilibaculum sp.]|uniref:sulfatase n=1 Tax=Labilibaculum sp. TaxID=2060723 RepID=UPI0035669099
MKRFQLFRTLPLFFLGAVLFTSCSSKDGSKDEKIVQPNILFIPVDDLRPELGAYGNDYILTPNIDRMAKQGITFTRAYCQQSVCNPSRASFMTGLRPDSLRVWDNHTKFRNTLSDVLTLPQYFKENGYHTVGFGKAFHNNDPDTISWSEVPEHLDGFPFDPDAVYLTDENIKIQQEKIERLKAAGRSKIDQLGHWYVKAKATEIADVEDDAYYDGAQTTRAIEVMERLAKQDEPFFLSVGYYRPHLPFNAPKKYWDLYKRDEIPLAENQFVPEGTPAFLVHGDSELRKSYTDCPDLPLPIDGPWAEERQREIKHGYCASVSYTDAQIGRLLNALDSLGLSENTIVVLLGDHGWKLGEHNGWGKKSNYEIDCRVPMIFSGAGVNAKGRKSKALTELVDVYPTLCELSGLEIPESLQGTSMVPLLSDPDQEWDQVALSQFLLGRDRRTTNIDEEQMGYAMRTDRYRYVEWYKWIAQDSTKGAYLRTELFDHENDAQENTNLANDPKYKELVDSLSEQLKQEYFK